jgi:transposase-like protein
MKEKLECPHCDTRQEPERLGPGRYLCHSCAREFYVPKGLRSA